jgi:hypothetical protein
VEEMTTVLGEAFFLLLGNKDFLIVIAAYTTALSLLYAILASWKYKR